jgi:endoglucanase
MPQDDTSVSVVVGTGAEPWKGACASGDFAAVMAIAARVYRPYDKAFAGRTLAAAGKATTRTRTRRT